MRLVSRVLLVALFVSLAFGTVRAQQNVMAGEIPEAAPPADEGSYDILNFLLLGSDTTNPNNAGRTDVILILSVNQTMGTVALLSIPRDLYVFVPDYGMQRINVAYGYGENDGVGPSGAELVEQTIEYNLGISIDYFARVDFNGFKEIVDNVGGVELSIDCAIEDWRLREPDLDPTVEDNWEMFTLPVGVQMLDGDLALWYVRSRRTSSDIDRGRRQQAMIRGLWQRVRTLGLLEQLGDLYPQVVETVDTDIPLDDLIGLAPLAVTIDSAHIASYTMRPNHEIIGWTAPGGASVLVPVADAVNAMVHQMMLPPTENQLIREQPSVEIVNASGIPGFDRIAADRLAVEGFVPSLAAERAPYRDYTVIYDYTGQSKGSSLETLMSVLRVGEASVVAQPNANRTVDFRIEIGGTYQPCTYAVMPPSPPTEEGA